MYSGARDDGQNAHDFCALPFLAKAKRSIGWHPSCAMVDGLRVLTGRWVARVRLVRRKRARVCVTSTSNLARRRTRETWPPHAPSDSLTDTQLAGNVPCLLFAVCKLRGRALRPRRRLS